MKVLERFSVLSVPATEAERVMGAVQSLRLAPARV